MVDELPGQLAVVHDMGRIINHSTAKQTMTAPEARQAKEGHATRLGSARLVWLPVGPSSCRIGPRRL